MATKSKPPRPNYLLLALGIVVIVLQIVVLHPLVASPVTNAALLALGVTFALYGVYPIPVMKGEFQGPLGTLAVTGPAALGLAVFGYLSTTLAGESEAQRAVQEAEDVIVLIASTTDRRYDSRTVETETISLLDVGSFDDERVSDLVDQLDNVLLSSGLSDHTGRRSEVERLLDVAVSLLRLGEPHHSTSLDAISDYAAGESDASVVNARWREAVARAAADAAEPHELVNRVKRLPFAIVAVEGHGRRVYDVLYDKKQLTLGSRTYHVPVIANPARRYVPSLEEAVILTVAAGH